VRAHKEAREAAERAVVEIRYYNIIMMREMLRGRFARLAKENPRAPSLGVRGEDGSNEAAPDEGPASGKPPFALGPELIADNKASPSWIFGLSFAGSTVVFAVGMSRRMMGLRRMNLPMCEAHSMDRWRLRVQRPRRNGSPTSRQGRLDAL
jgi:hypothetical protein